MSRKSRQTTVYARLHDNTHTYINVNIKIHLINRNPNNENESVRFVSAL